jgi:hypothetical protein
VFHEGCSDTMETDGAHDGQYHAVRGLFNACRERATLFGRLPPPMAPDTFRETRFEGR